METQSKLEEAIGVFPELKEFVDYVIETGGESQLRVEDGRFIWFYGRSDFDFYQAEINLDRKHPSMSINFREGQWGTVPFCEPSNEEEVLEKLPQIVNGLKDSYRRTFIEKKYICDPLARS